jgi:hypothetical protein
LASARRGKIDTPLSVHLAGIILISTRLLEHDIDWIWRKWDFGASAILGGRFHLAAMSPPIDEI